VSAPPLAAGRQELAGTLRRVPFLARLGDVQIDALAAAGESRWVPAETVLFEEGAAGDGLYVILVGRVRIVRNADGHDPLAVTEFGPGDFFGEVALLDGGARSATAVAGEACELFVLGREPFLALLASSPYLIGEVFTNLTDRIRNTTERLYREEIEAQTLRANMERERHRALAQLVAGVAHEINTPIGIANTAACLITRGLSSPPLVKAAAADADVKVEMEDLGEAVRLIEANVARAHRLIQSFKSLSVAEASERPEALVLPELVAEAIDLFSPAARQAKLEVHVEDALPEDRRAWFGRRGHLIQILLNVLTNVARYAYPDGAGGSVEIRLAPAGDGHVLLSVRDRGRGIPAGDLPRVFEPFFTTGRSKGGTGLGMAIVRNLVTAGLGGTIGIESEVGAGTVVTVTVPQTVQQE
jgi:signal transduction histidine kinase